MPVTLITCEDDLVLMIGTWKKYRKNYICTNAFALNGLIVHLARANVMVGLGRSIIHQLVS